MYVKGEGNVCFKTAVGLSAAKGISIGTYNCVVSIRRVVGYHTDILLYSIAVVKLVSVLKIIF